MNNLFSDITQAIMQAPIGSACSVDLAVIRIQFGSKIATGNVLDLALYAGTSAAQINDALPAATIVKQLCTNLPKAI